MKVKIGVVGAGKRVHDMYAPVLAASDAEVVGFWNRDEEKGRRLTQAFGYDREPNLEALAKRCDALAIAVNSNALTEVTMRCLDFGKPLLVETPVWTKDVVEKANRLKVSVAVAEQTPFLPSEQFKMLLLEGNRELLGVPHTVVNDFRTFEYHGLAQLRRYIGFDKVPVEVCGMSHAAPMAPFKDGNGVEQRGHTENWDSGQIRFASGELAIYNFSSLYNRCQYRHPRSLRIYTDRATISNKDNLFDVSAGKDDASIETLYVFPYQQDSKTISIRAWKSNEDRDLPLTCWKALTEHLNDQQEALKVLVDNFCAHVASPASTPLTYDAAQGWTDFNLLMAIRHSSARKQYIHR